LDRSANAYPVERVSPCIMHLPSATCFFQDVEEMNRSLVILVVSQCLRKRSESHRKMRIGNRKSLRLPEEATRRRHECFTKNNRGNRYCPQQMVLVIQGLGALTNRTRIESLEVVRDLTIPIKPTDESFDRGSKFLPEVVIHYGVLHRL